jgi:RNA polymerase sigma-70 factor (ECF subfamily)
MARSDVQLMLEVKQGDEASFELLLQRYRTPLCHFLSRMVRDPALAEDLAQEAFLRVYRARRDYQPSAKFTTWLFRIATNLALNAIRDRRFRQKEDSLDQRREDEDGEPITLEVADSHPGAEQHLIDLDRAVAIRHAVFALPEKQRAAVLLHKFHEMNYEDIAKILDCSVSALKSLLFRAYETLRVQLAPMVASAQAAGSSGPGGGNRS